ncbi:UNKNOWN [Stylonychia lemnae]|uniref:Uncharacterized protein n=1 Tax=Stylonychia lemnae TaxID=5949 RepID=A0A077ZUV2_STYLE|nr:UNKNOWN [Stylonychia lemnae]|eukprot:CDW73329.1 UNKNOWN [Stylonychia lemnae]
MEDVTIECTKSKEASTLFFDNINGILISQRLYLNYTSAIPVGNIYIFNAVMVELHDTQLYNPIGMQLSSFLSFKYLKQSAYLSNTIIDCFRYGGPDQYDERPVQSVILDDFQQIYQDSTTISSLIYIFWGQLQLNNFTVQNCDIRGQQQVIIADLQKNTVIILNSTFTNFQAFGFQFGFNQQVYFDEVKFIDVYSIGNSFLMFMDSRLSLNNVTLRSIISNSGLIDFTYAENIIPSELIIKNSIFQDISMNAYKSFLQVSQGINFLYFDQIIIKNITNQIQQQQGLITVDPNIFYETVNTFIIKNSYIGDFESVQGQTQLLYSKQPQLNLTIINTTIECSSVMADSLILDENQNLGIIYIEDSIYGFHSYDSIFRQCQKSNNGQFIHLKNTKFDDSFSTFQNNLAPQGGVFLCNSCSIKMENSIFKNNLASQGGCIFTDDTVQIILMNITIISNQALRDGGFIYMRQNSQQTDEQTIFILKNSNSLFDNQATRGGFIYSANPSANIILQNITVSSISSSLNGGFISLQSGLKLLIQNSKFDTFKSIHGALVYSTADSITINISNSVFICDAVETFKNKSFQLSDGNYQSDSDTQIYVSNAAEFHSSQNLFQYCGTSSLGGVFTLTKTKFNDFKSTYMYNSGLYGGVIYSQESQSVLIQSKFSSNQAKLGGTFYMVSYSNLTIINCEFSENYASESGGVLFLSTQSILQISGSEFTKNVAQDNSVLDVLGANLNYVIKIEKSIFEDNYSVRNTLSFVYANVLLSDSQFKNNIARERTKGILCGFANITIEKTFFISQISNNYLQQLQDEQTTGSYIFLIFNVNMKLRQTQFWNGMSNLGGAIFISGDSIADIQQSTFQNNKARSKGGAIYATSFKSIYIGNNTILKDNYAIDQGEDIYLTNSVNTLTLNKVQISNVNAKNSIYIEQAKLYAVDLIIKDIYSNIHSQSGGGINCQYCTGLDIRDSTFSNLRSVYGGAIYIIDFDLNKGTTDIEKTRKFFITNSVFKNCSAQEGGAIMTENAQSVLLMDNQFIWNKAMIIKDQLIQVSEAGSGGAIYYTCNDDILNCKLTFDGVNIFKFNYAQIQGGAIYWNSLEPIYNNSNLNFINNSAKQYGDNMACYAQNLGSLSKQQYKEQMIKIGLYTLDDFDYRELQYYQSDEIMFNQSVDNQRSGGQIPIIYMALIDKYGQIVGSDFQSKVRISVQTNNLDSKASMFPPILEGSSDFSTLGGVSVIDSVFIAGNPGSKYQISFSTDGIDLTKPSNKEYLQKLSSSDLNFLLDLKLRECQIGEQFTSVGKCQKCEDSYSLIQMREPGSCAICPTEKAVCLGGANIGPLPGYWRKKVIEALCVLIVKKVTLEIMIINVNNALSIG